MKISIITVCFNSDQTIRNTIESVLSQVYSDIEYIIVDGSSTDRTVNIIKQFKPLFKGRMTWISESDKGLYDAMNKGIAMATGDLIGIINSDDTFYNNRVLKEVANFHENNKIDASVGNIIQHNAYGKIVRKYSASNWNPEKLKIGFMAPHPAIFFKRTLFEKFGNYELDYVIAADYELIIRFFLKNKISWKYSDITTTAMLVGGLSSSGTSSYKLITKEIQKALTKNEILFSPFKIRMRFLLKIIELIKK